LNIIIWCRYFTKRN